MQDGVHILPIRVYYEDTDFGGGIYHASYVRFLERGRTELLRSVSVSQRDLHRDMEGLTFVVRRMTLDYLKPGHMDDVLHVLTRPKEMRGASMTLAQEIRRGDELLLTADVVVAAVKAGRAVRIPEELRTALSGER
ncbi:tol-pal system-associated acyl-CoA thioesterase [Microvirga flocculans]|nr:tol-pal system-associated acyl-CoA thioesterase [Microvirga flocculans]